MTTLKTYSLGIFAGLSLLACGDSNNGVMHDGAQARFTAFAMGSVSHDEKAEGGNRSFRSSDGVRIDLQAGLVNLVPIEIKRCTSVAGLLKQTGDFVLGSAYAHAGEDHGVAEPTAYLSALNHEASFIGALPLDAGEYCSIVLALTPAHDSESQESDEQSHGEHGAKHGAVDTTFGGHALNVAPCHFFHTAQLSDAEYEAGEYDTEHSCIQVKLGQTENTLELDFLNPVTITAEQHHLLIEMMAHYETWFDGIVMDDRPSVGSEQQRLIENIKASIHIAQIGFE